MAEALRANKNGRCCANGVSLTQNFRYKGSSPTNHFSRQKTRINILSCGIKIWAELSFTLSQITRLTDGQTDGQHFAG